MPAHAAPRLLAAGLLTLASCSGGNGDASSVPAAARLDAMTLVRSGGGWLLVGRFELRRAEFLEDEEAADGDLPMTMISWPEFAAWAEERGLRGLTPAEWRLAAGPAAGAAADAALTRNTLELGLRRALPVGVFERGRSPLGGYDYYGNVWEMTAPEPGGRVLAFGGSFASREVGVEPRDAFPMGEGDRAEDVGARYGADAIPYFLERVEPEWREDPASAAEAVRAAARRWQPALRAGFAQSLRGAGAAAELCSLLGP